MSFPKHHHAVLLGQSFTATHNYLLGYIFTLYPSLYGHPVRSHLFMFITVSHLPEEDDWRFRRGPRWDLRAPSSPIVARGAEASHPYSDYESVTRHKRNNNSWWLLCIQNLHRQVGSLARFSASSSRAHRRFHKRSSTRSTFNQIRSL